MCSSSISSSNSISNSNSSGSSLSIPVLYHMSPILYVYLNLK